MKITIGSDPEIFIEDKEGNIASAIGLIKGSKRKPHPITNEGHFIQTDNIAMEYNIPPCETEEEFVHHIHFVKDYLEVIAKANGYNLSKKVSGEVLDKYLNHPQAKEFGCEPDLNPYTESVNPKPDSDTNLRCVGGHVAIGYPEPTIEISEKIVKAFDIFVVLPSLLLDNDKRRRELYGKAGSFRFTPFGIECRALSNFWIQSKELTAWVYKNTIKAVEFVLYNNEIDELISNYSERVVEAINTNNKELAEELLEQIFKKENNLINV